MSMSKLCSLHTFKVQTPQYGAGSPQLKLCYQPKTIKAGLTRFLSFSPNYFFRYITSFTSLTVRGTSGRAAATRLGA